MGASVVVYWPSITEKQFNSQPGFDNDDRAWGNWMAEREEEPLVLDAIKKLGADAILTLKTDGWDDEDVNWVTPQQLRDAALKLREAVLAQSPETQIILETYERNANRMYPIDEEFLLDLENIIAMTRWAEEQGATKLTLEVNW